MGGNMMDIRIDREGDQELIFPPLEHIEKLV